MSIQVLLFIQLPQPCQISSSPIRDVLAPSNAPSIINMRAKAVVESSMIGKASLFFLFLKKAARLSRTCLMRPKVVSG